MLDREKRSEVDGHYYPWANPSLSKGERDLALWIRAYIIANFADEELETHSCTSLGEMIAHETGHEDWLDPENAEHVLWDVCLDIYDYLDLTAQ